jgi:hypothetical protein
MAAAEEREGKKMEKDQDIVQHQHVVDIPDTGKHDLIRLDG